MIKLDITTKTVGFADGTYRVWAKGCIAAVLCWADSRGELPDRTPFAYVPITPNGEGQFRFTGHRVVPDEALQPKEWTDGNIVHLELSEKQAEIAAISIGSGQRISRGYYRFIKEP